MVVPSPEHIVVTVYTGMLRELIFTLR